MTIFPLTRYTLSYSCYYIYIYIYIYIERERERERNQFFILIKYIKYNKMNVLTKIKNFSARWDNKECFISQLF